MKFNLMEVPYWYKLLNCWVNEDGNSGLSLPFIVGVKSVYIDSIPDEDSIATLLNEIIHGPAQEFCVTIEFCRTIEAYRLGLINRRFLNKPFLTNQTNEPTLTIEGNALEPHITPEEVIAFLNGLYLDHVKCGRYSRNSSSFGDWGPFDNKDKNFISRALEIKI